MVEYIVNNTATARSPIVVSLALFSSASNPLPIIYAARLNTMNDNPKYTSVLISGEVSVQINAWNAEMNAMYEIENMITAMIHMPSGILVVSIFSIFFYYYKESFIFKCVFIYDLLK
ncbi:MAG: hypothetical protein ACI83O_000182 [Patescibacteria group bacterium]|jgi:hypothetical protein